MQESEVSCAFRISTHLPFCSWLVCPPYIEKDKEAYQKLKIANQ
jgi:hypothetical protein